METQSSECGFICKWSKYKNIWVKGCQFDKNAMWEKENILPIVSVYFVCSKEKKMSKTTG